jgi:chromodomain-helicase-DNA-binding protein 4
MMFVFLQEFRQWGADLNSVIYQGDKESRTMIRNYEFYTKGKIPLFDVLVTSYDLAMLDNTLLAKFNWSCIIGLSLSLSYLYQV